MAEFVRPPVGIKSDLSELEELRRYKLEMEDRIERLKEATRKHSDPAWHGRNPAAHGRANGLRHAVATLKGEAVRYRSDPPQWADKDFKRFPTRHGGMIEVGVEASGATGSSDSK